MEDITIGEVALALAFIVGVWKSIDYLIEKANQPKKEMQQQMNFIFKMTFALLEHQITGDHMNDMDKLYQEAKNYLLNQ